jgi:hypothetical protein
MNDHALADPAHVAYDTAHCALPEPVHPRRHRNRQPPTWHSFDILNA